MSTRRKIIGVVAVLVLMGASFWGGTMYQKSQVPARGNFAGFGGAAGTTGAARAGFAGRTAGGGATTGQVVSATASSMTVKLASGSTQLVLLGSSTQIAKSVSGSASDLTAGTNVIVTGSSNSDGSITASMIQVRPATNR